MWRQLADAPLQKRQFQPGEIPRRFIPVLIFRWNRTRRDFPRRIAAQRFCGAFEMAQVIDARNGRRLIILRSAVFLPPARNR